MKITIVGSGYVGMSLSVMIAQKHTVTVLDIDKYRVEKINKKLSTISDTEIEDFLTNKKLSLTATLSKEIAYKNADFIIVATPTNYDDKKNYFDTSSVDKVVQDSLDFNSKATIIIKSTIPVGHTEFLQKKFSSKKIIFSPEFLREGQALIDNLNPSRIVIGSSCNLGKKFAKILAECADKKNIKLLFMSSTEAEALKLFANTYLAMRVSFFNELDTYALSKSLDPKNIIDGICYDERIGHGYNNPSFGYGGYCLPKDTKQLLANFDNIPQELISSIISSNSTRKDFLAEQILKDSPKTIGFYRLIMKEGSDNFRSSSIKGIIKRLNDKSLNIIIYEPELLETKYLGNKVIKDFSEFELISDLIVTNRISDELLDIDTNVFSRDLYGYS